MRRALTLAATTAFGAAGLLGASAPAANALPTNFYVVGSQPTQALFDAGTGHIRAWQLCETSNGQTDFYLDGPWVGINTWSSSGTCAHYRGSHGADISN
jgi:hypothetical protein